MWQMLGKSLSLICSSLSYPLSESDKCLIFLFSTCKLAVKRIKSCFRNVLISELDLESLCAEKDYWI